MTHPCKVMKKDPDGGTAYNVFGLTAEVLATGEETGGVYSAWRTIVAPGQGPPPHLHHAVDETFYVLEGRFEIRYGEETATVEGGGFIFLPRRLPHTFHNVGQGTGRLLCISTPAGMDAFFREIDALGDPAFVAREAVMAISRKHGIEPVAPR